MSKTSKEFDILVDIIGQSEWRTIVFPEYIKKYNFDEKFKDLFFNMRTDEFTTKFLVEIYDKFTTKIHHSPFGHLITNVNTNIHDNIKASVYCIYLDIDTDNIPSSKSILDEILLLPIVDETKDVILNQHGITNNERLKQFFQISYGLVREQVLIEMNFLDVVTITIPTSTRILNHSYKD